MIPGEPLGHIPPHAPRPRQHKSLRLPASIEEDGNAIVGVFWAILFTVIFGLLVLLFAVWVSTFFETEPNIQPCTTNQGGYCIVEP